MEILKMSPESIFIDVLSKIIQSYKNKFAKKAEVKVRSNNRRK